MRYTVLREGNTFPNIIQGNITLLTHSTKYAPLSQKQVNWCAQFLPVIQVNLRMHNTTATHRYRSRIHHKNTIIGNNCSQPMSDTKQRSVDKLCLDGLLDLTICFQVHRRSSRVHRCLATLRRIHGYRHLRCFVQNNDLAILH